MSAASELVVYCLTRDRELAADLEARLADALAFFYNDAARLHQAVILRRPDRIVIDTGAVREEYGDAGLGPVVAFLHDRAPDAAVAVRPTAGAEWLIAAEAGEGIRMLSAEVGACADEIVAFCG